MATFTFPWTGTPFAVQGNGDGSNYPVIVDGGNTYATVAASQTAQGLGATGAAGDFLKGLTVIPSTTGAGSISIKDGSTVISVFVSGTLSDTKPFYIPIGAISQNGKWAVTTGANVSVLAVGKFT